MAEVKISATQSGGSIRIRPGDELTVSLTENPTTGFRWAVETSGEPVLAPIDSHYERGAEEGMGAGGQRTFRFRAVTPGEARLGLVLRQEWLPDSATERFQIQVDVEP